MSEPISKPADIMVVDDTANNLWLLIEILLKAGYHVRPVTEGQLAITAAQLQPPDLVLLDVKMPDIDGYEVCQALNADERTQDIPVIFLTVLDDAVDKVKGFAAGGVDYITKPFEAAELMARVENQLRLRSLQQQLVEKNQSLASLLQRYEATTVALQESEAKFSKTFKNSPLPTSLASISDGRYLDVNEAFLRHSGYIRAEVIGRTVTDLKLWADWSVRTEMLTQVQAKGYVHDLEAQLRTKSGTLRDVILFVEIIQLEGQHYLLVTGQDVTERKAAEKQLMDRTQELTQALSALQESEAKFSKAFRNSPLPITLSSRSDGRYVDVNDAFVQHSGYTRAELVGKTTLELGLWVDLDERKRLFHLLESQGYVHGFETCLRMKSGAVREVILFLENIQMEEDDYLLITGEDITQRKVAEQQLAAQTQELTEALNTLKQTQTQLVQSAKMAALGQLVAGVAHEINTPVGTAIMMASTLENATHAILTDVVQGQLTQTAFHNYLDVAKDASHLILENLNRAGELVQSFKQVAVDQTSLKDRVFALKPYLQEVITNLTPQLKHTLHTVTLIGDDTLTLHSYPGALSQVITNLVVNSLSHAFTEDQSGHIEVMIQADNGQYVIKYADDGVGIPPEHHDQLFEPFFTTARHKGGSGLGLHLVYNLVTQRLQGQIRVASTLGQGTTFTITLPPALEIRTPDSHQREIRISEDVWAAETHVQ